MARLIRDFTWGTLEDGFAVVDGVFRETHPWRSRDGATFVSSHGAIVTSDHRLEYDKPLRFLAPMDRADRREAGLMREDLIAASGAQFAMADLGHDRYTPFEEHTGLFRAFAALRSEADVIAFANRFGPLGADLSTAPALVLPSSLDSIRGREVRRGRVRRDRFGRCTYGIRTGFLNEQDMSRSGRFAIAAGISTLEPLIIEILRISIWRKYEHLADNSEWLPSL